MFLPILILFIISLSGLFITYSKNLQKNFLDIIISFGAGVIISLSIVHILPESIKANEFAPFYFIAGFLIIYVIENFLMIHSCIEHDCHYHHIGIISWVALFIHTLFDGIGIGAGFSISGSLGYLILIGVAIHQIPVSISIASLLKQGKFSKKIQTIFMIIFGLSAPIGIFLSLTFFDKSINIGLPSIFLALSGGSLLYIGASDLLPSIHKKTGNRKLIIFAFLIGIIGTSLIKFFE